MKDGHLLPSLFVPLLYKTEATNTRMWQQVQLLCPQADPAEILMDFQLAVINSFQHTWPADMVKGCFFHLRQDLWCKVQVAGMQAVYSQHQELAIRIRQIPALAFAALHEVPDLFAEVAAQLPTPEAKRTYIGRTLPGGGYQQALFPIDMWNYYFHTGFGLPRTTNAVEAWHRCFNATVGCHHPNIQWRINHGAPGALAPGPQDLEGPH